MTPLFKKLNLKEHREIVVLNVPESFEHELEALEGVTIYREADRSEKIDFGIAFVTSAQAVVTAAALLTTRVEGDATLWFAYPKGTSRRYICDINRDTGWQPLGDAGFEAVRQVAIDEDWSAVRFRKLSYIKSLKRDPSRASSAEGKSRAATTP